MLKDHSELLNEVKHDEYSRAFIEGQRINMLNNARFQKKSLEQECSPRSSQNRKVETRSSLS